MPFLDKVLIYITRTVTDGDELLVFNHRDLPTAGTKVPAGTVEAGEAFDAAAVRELNEESGLAGIALRGPIDAYDWLHAATDTVHRRHVFHAHASGLPDAWHHTVHGEGDEAGSVFVYRWIPLASASSALAHNQGQSVCHIGRATRRDEART